MRATCRGSTDQWMKVRWHVIHARAFRVLAGIEHLALSRTTTRAEQGLMRLWAARITGLRPG
jgi:hypothetical protein